MGGGNGDGAGSEGNESNKAEGADAVTINVRHSNGIMFSVQASLESTVESFRSVVERICDIPAGEQRFVYKGLILQDDQTLKSYGMEAEHTVHLVHGFVPATSTPAGGAPTRANTSPPAAGEAGLVEGGATGETDNVSLGRSGSRVITVGMLGVTPAEVEQMQQQLNENPNMMREIMNLGIIKRDLNNPDMMRNVIGNNPQMREITYRNPELGHMLNDPAIPRQIMEAARNPELRREMMRNNDRAMSNIESSPEGFNMLRRMYENVQEPFLNAATMGGGGDTTNDLPDPTAVVAAILGRGQGPPPRDQVANSTTTVADTTSGSPAPNINPLPNPWAAGGGGGANQTNAAATILGGAARSPPVGDFDVLAIPNLQALFGSTTDPNVMSQHLQNPVISWMITSLICFPQYMNLILGANLETMLESNPQLGELLHKPDFIRHLTSPETRQEMMSLGRSLSQRLGMRQPTRDVGQTGGGIDALHNQHMDRMMNFLNSLGPGGLTPNSSIAPPEELFAPQLAQLQELGFSDTRENLQALAATRGNVPAAVERLSGNLGQKNL